MVPINSYDSFWKHIAQIVGITQVLLVSDEAELANCIKEVADQATILVAVIPPSDTDARDNDNLLEADPCVIFVVQKIDPKDYTYEQMLKARSDTQALMTSVKLQMKAHALDYDHNDAGTLIMRRLDLNKMHTEPEYNYLGCTGWSLSFLLKSKNLKYDTP
jgi:hypothetical protein